jgi:hypothetical protein
MFGLKKCKLGGMDHKELTLEEIYHELRGLNSRISNIERTLNSLLQTLDMG